MNLADRIVALHRALNTARIPHAFGGALALAWCTQRARGTIDIDINLFVPPDQFDRVTQALPDGIDATAANRREIESSGQTRLWWEQTPIDIFFNTTEFHEQVAIRANVERFNGHDIPFLACRDLAVFKAFFDRTRDWADLEEMQSAGTLDIEWISATLAHYLGADDPRLERLSALRTTPR